MSSHKHCFVIMPIRQPGTEEYEHYRTIRDTIIEPALVALDYSVVRADDINQSGAITADIISRLSAADLVVADLTGLNPNVFYELGVRHALRKQGTIMLVDETRSDIPFDLAQYRIIKYQPTLSGAEYVRRKLHDFAICEDGHGCPDNPVHTFLPQLPEDVLAQASGSAEGALRSEIGRLNETIRRYEREYGNISEAGDELESVIEDLLGQARDGLLPDNLLAQAKSAFDQRDVKVFLETVRILFRGTVRLSTLQFAELANWALGLGLPDLQASVFEKAVSEHPDDNSLERLFLQTLAHSSNATKEFIGWSTDQAVM